MEPARYSQVLVLVAACKDEPPTGDDDGGVVPLAAGAPS